MNAITLSDFTITTMKWKKLDEPQVRQSVTYFTLLRSACAVLEILHQKSSTNRFKYLPISYYYTENFHMHGNHMHMVYVTQLG